MTPSGPFADARHLPFSAVVGQDEPKTALLLAAIAPTLGGVLLRGDKGSGKTTLARGLAALLPGEAPFMELPLGATEDRVLGSIDIVALLEDATHGFRPGLLAAAHGGVLYVDEINLLADHLVDALLDVAASGVNRVERDGISHSHPARFVLVGSMNPEEGELRPQLLDRFGLACEVRASADPADRTEIVRRQLAFEAGAAVIGGAHASADAADPAGDAVARHRGDIDGQAGRATSDADADANLAERLAAAVPAAIDAEVIAFASRLALAVGAEGLRADLSLCRAAAALAGWEGRSDADTDDVARVAPLVLAHRRRRNPFDAPGISDDELADALEQAEPTTADDTMPDEPIGPDDSNQADTSPELDQAPSPEPSPRSEEQDGREQNGEPGQPRDPEQPSEPAPRSDPEVPSAMPQPPRPSAGDDQTMAPDASLRAPTLPASDHRRRQAPRPGNAGAGPVVAGPAGRFVRAVPMDDRHDRLAPAATAVAYAARRAGDPAAQPSAADLRAAHTEQPAGRLLVIAVDTSGSMHAQRRIAAAKAAAFGILADAYRRRDRVAVVAFRGETAEIVLRPTGSVEIAKARLADLPSGGTTPLAAGLDAVTALIRPVANAAVPTGTPLVVVLTDGRATAGGADPRSEARRAATDLARTGA
ncbi:MAG: ATP-binding protein, partial [Acidimicrobiales bacterium]